MYENDSEMGKVVVKYNLLLIRFGTLPTRIVHPKRNNGFPTTNFFVSFQLVFISVLINCLPKAVT